jgi:hypothetical protein
LTAAFSREGERTFWLGEDGKLRQVVVDTIGPADLIESAANDD